MTESLLTSGARVGRFVVVRPLGAGGMGAVYEARDPELARSVALKLLHRDDPQLGMRLLREAQALAQLQHPNVVAVHELDLHEDRVFVAMELVDGETLDRYIERTRPDWRGIVELFVQAGRGLVAAHDKGIVHRDIKPSNLFVDAGGRVRVGDFGLARIADDSASTPRDGAGDEVTSGDEQTTADDADPVAAAPTPQPHTGLLASPLTRAGAVLGTPYYMAPEQREGRKATAATDQFGFCVALWLALFDEHPFDASIEGGLRKAVATGVRKPAPRRRLPRSLVRALDRGLAVRPQDRHPSMAALVDALAATTVRRNRVVAGVAAVAVAAAVVATVAIARRGGVEAVCDDGGADRALTPEVRAAFPAAFAAARPTGADTAQRVTAALDDYRDRWRTARTDSCTRDAALRDRTVHCLDREAEQLRQVVAAFEHADGKTVDRALDLVAGLPSPESCATGTAALPYPADPRVASIEADLASTRLLAEIAPTPAVRTVAARTLAAATELGHPGLLAEARMVDADVGDRPRDEISKQLEQALAEAKRAGDAALEAAVDIRILERVATDRNVQAIESMLPVARAASAATSDAAIQLRFARAEALALQKLGRIPESLAACDRIAGLERVPSKPRAAACRCAAQLAAARPREAKTACTASLAAAEAYYGPNTAATQSELNNLANTLRKLGEYAESTKLRERSLALVKTIYGPDGERMGASCTASACCTSTPARTPMPSATSRPPSRSSRAAPARRSAWPTPACSSRPSTSASAMPRKPPTKRIARCRRPRRRSARSIPTSSSACSRRAR